MGKRGEVLRLMGGEGSSGSSRDVPNIIYPIPNASVDSHAHELINIMNGEGAIKPTHANNSYFLLKLNIKWTQLNYNFDTNTYNVLQKKSASTTPRDPSSDDAEAQNASTTPEDSSLNTCRSHDRFVIPAEDSSPDAIEGQIASTAYREEPSSNAAEVQKDHTTKL